MTMDSAAGTLHEEPTVAQRSDGWIALTINCKPELKRRLTEAAIREGISTSAWIRYHLETILDAGVEPLPGEYLETVPGKRRHRDCRLRLIAGTRYRVCAVCAYPAVREAAIGLPYEWQ